MKMLFAHKECDFVLPMLKIISASPYGCTISQIINAIPDNMILNDEDLKPSPTRKGEFKYQQIVRNLISHKNKAFLECVDIDKTNPKKSVFFLNKNGQKKISSINTSSIAQAKMQSPQKQSVITHIDTKKTDNMRSSDSDIYHTASQFNLDKYDFKILEQINNPKFNGKIKTDNSLAEDIKRIHGFECLYTRLTGCENKTFVGKNDNNYIHSHHLIPMSAQKLFFPKSLDRPSNIVPIAPFFHDILHHGKKKDKEPILFVLYNALIKDLNNDNIFISFEQLLKYY